MKTAWVIFLLASFAQPELKKAVILIGKNKLTVELATTQAQQTAGLMFRKNLEANSGMLFVFKESSPRAFWMKNTFIPLSLAFIDENKKIIDIKDLMAVQSEMDTNPDSVKSNSPAKYVLEVNKGWFAKKKIKIGDSFQFTK